MTPHEACTSAVVVVGGGVAGLRTALALAPRSVLLVTKSAFGRGGASPLARGGIAAALGRWDSPSQHALDTLRVGGGLNDSRVVELLTDSAQAEIDRLLGREGGSLRRLRPPS